jgi:hypothetical protein
MRSSWFLCYVAALTAPATLAQTPKVTLCLVQVSRDGHDLFQNSGADARNLAIYLSDRALPNGTPILPIVVTHLREGDVNRITEQRGCQYIAEFVRHESVDSPGQPFGCLDPVEASSIGDRDMILFTLRKAGSRKVLGHLATPLLTRRGRIATVQFDPYPLFVNEIMKRIPATEPGIISELGNPGSQAMTSEAVAPMPSKIAAPNGYSSFEGTWTASRNGTFDGRFHLTLEKGSKVTAAKFLETGRDEPLLLHGSINPTGTIEMRDYSGCPVPCVGSLSADGHQIHWPGDLFWIR